MEKTLERATELIQALTREKPMVKQEETAAEHTASSMVVYLESINYSSAVTTTI